MSVAAQGRALAELFKEAREKARRRSNLKGLELQMKVIGKGLASQTRAFVEEQRLWIPIEKSDYRETVCQVDYSLSFQEICFLNSPIGKNLLS